jgi:hypothetical protein
VCAQDCAACTWQRNDDDDADAPIGLPPPTIEVAREFEPEFETFLGALPALLSDSLRDKPLLYLRERLVEVIVDVGRPVRLMFRDGRNMMLRCD